MTYRVLVERGNEYEMREQAVVARYTDLEDATVTAAVEVQNARTARSQGRYTDVYAVSVITDNYKTVDKAFV